MLSVVISLGFIVTTATSAQALNLGTLAKGALKIGMPVVTGVTIGARVSNPIGWAVTGAQIAYWGYTERDTLFGFDRGPDTPMTLEEFGEADPDFVIPEAQSPEGWKAFGSGGGLSGKVLSVSGRDALIEIKCTNRWSNGVNKTHCGNSFSDNIRSFNTHPTTSVTSALQTATRASCKQASGAVVVRQGTSAGLGFGNYTLPDYALSNAGDDAAWTFHRTLTMCNTGETLEGFAIAPRIAGQYKQTFGIAYGTLLGAPLPPGDVEFGEAEVTARCINTQTGEEVELQSRSALGTSGTVVVPSCKQHLGDDYRGKGFTVAPTKPEIDNEPIPDEIEVPDFLPFDWDELIPEPDDPDWQPCHGTRKGCTLDIWIDNQPCTVGTGVCTKWVKVLEANPSRVKCVLGSREVAMKYCRPALQDLYKPDTEVDTGTKTEVPVTGNTDTSTGTGTSTQTRPKESSDGPVQDGCFPKGWGVFNPFEWVYKPVVCALKAAFIPSRTFGSWATSLAGFFNGRAPFTWITSLNSLPGSIASGGCPTDWVFKFQGREYPVLCGTAVGDKLHSYRPLITTLVLGAAMYPFLRSLVYSVIPILKPTPSGGGDS